MSQNWAIASGTIAVAMSTLEFPIVFRSFRTILLPTSQNWRKLGGAFCLGIPIYGMHYLAMNATIFRTASVRLTRFSEIDDASLAIVIAVAAILVIVLALLSSHSRRRLSAEIARSETLQQSEFDSKK